MGNIIYYTFIIGIFALNIQSLYKDRNENNFLYKEVYLKNYSDWLFAIYHIFVVIILYNVLKPIMPEFMNWSWLNLLGKDNTNANIEIMSQVDAFTSGFAYYFTMIIIYLFFVLLLPKAAFYEETIFRKNKNTLKQIIISNIIFGFIHCIVGVSLFLGFILVFAGLLLSMRYHLTLKKTGNADLALLRAISTHAKYNFLLVTLLFIILIFQK